MSVVGGWMDCEVLQVFRWGRGFNPQVGIRILKNTTGIIAAALNA
jgi:hypothetical protein